MKNSEKILKVASELKAARRERIDAIVAPLRKKAQDASAPAPAAAAPAATVPAAPAPAAAPAAAPAKPETPTINALAQEAKAKGKYALGKFKGFGTKDPVGGGAATGAVLGGVYGLIAEALRSRREGERKNYLRSMLLHSLLGTAGGALLGNYKPSVVKDGLQSLPS